MNQVRLKELLFYSPDTGFFMWRINRQCVSRGVIAGGVKIKQSGKRYIVIGLDSKTYPAHRLAWLYIKGEWPNQIDHLDGNGMNNKFFNLRDTTVSENNKNKRVYSSNKSGVNGVTWYKPLSKWKAEIESDNKRYYLGYYVDKFEAICVRKSAEVKYKFHVNNNTKRGL